MSIKKLLDFTEWKCHEELFQLEVKKKSRGKKVYLQKQISDIRPGVQENPDRT